MTAKNNIYLNKRIMDVLEKIAIKRGTTKLIVLREWLDSLGVGDDNVKSIVLQIPSDLLTNNRDLLKIWLNNKSQGILNHFYPR